MKSMNYAQRFHLKSFYLALLLSLSANIVLSQMRYQSHFAQSKVITLEDAISTAHTNSISSMVVRNTFLSKYWGYRAFKAELLPSLNMRTSIANLDRSLRALQDANTGEVFYRENFNLRNEASVSINQNVVATGGRISLNSSLLRLDQYSPSRTITYYSQPITLSYMQPLWSFNRLKWDKKIEPYRYETSKREYLEGMEDITLRTVQLFFELALSQLNLAISESNYANTSTLASIAKERYSHGALTRNDLLQIEIRMMIAWLSTTTD